MAHDILSAVNRLDNLGGGGVHFVLSNTSSEQITLSQIDLVIKGTRH